MKWLACLLLLVALPSAAHAQNWIRIPTCGTASPPAGAGLGYMDATGDVCVSGGGGSGGAVTLPTSPSYTGGNGVVVGNGSNQLAVGSNGAASVQGPSGGPVLTAMGSGDPCSSVAHTYTPISITSSTQIITGTSAKKTYVCHLFLIAGAADNVGIVEGTGSICASSTVGVIGGATAASGANLAANAGFVEGTGLNAVAATATAADNLCLLVSASSQLSGVIVTVQQ